MVPRFEAGAMTGEVGGGGGMLLESVSWPPILRERRAHARGWHAPLSGDS